VPEKVRANAELVVQVAREHLGVDIGYDEAGVRWLDGYIQRQHELGAHSDREGLVSTLGSYLGECIVHCYGGSWCEQEGRWCVRFDDQNTAFPFAKVAKQLENGQEDSVLSFFQIIPLLLKGKYEHQ
jgi:hypothetical protein